MRYFTAVLFTLTSFTCSAQDQPLFPITENGRTGFIDSSCKVTIKPVFRVAYNFSEGLACARINGTYGYIDQTGHFVIPPQFDYAFPFSEGFAVVYKDGKPFYINREGKKAFGFDFPYITNFSGGRAIITTATGRVGCINRYGKFILDTLYSDIGPFIDGLAVVNEYYPHDPVDKMRIYFPAAVVDTLGNTIIPYGKYSDIQDLHNGYFMVTIPAEPWDTIDGSSLRDGFIDKKTGKLVLSRDHSNDCWIESGLSCGLARMHLYKYWLPEEDYSISKTYTGFINLDGKIVINDTNYEYAYDFSDNRAFVRTVDGKYLIIDTKGRVVSKMPYDEVMLEGFRDGLAFVRTGEKWGLIDTNDNFLISPRFEEIETRVTAGHFIFIERDPGGNAHMGIARKDGNILLKPVMQGYYEDHFTAGIFGCIIDDKLTYIDKEGKILWQEKDEGTKQFTGLSIDFMNRGYFYAYSKRDKDAIGGYGGSDNFPRKISNRENFPADSLTITVRADMTDTMYGMYKGLKVFIANTSKRDARFNAQDSRLYMKVQALDTKGEWRDIEYLPSSWCGNSYHTLELKKKYYWTFLTPAYEGDYKTRLRIELKYLDPGDASKSRREAREITIYSNEYEGSVNPGQFWRKYEYSPRGIMDPYYD